MSLVSRSTVLHSSAHRWMVLHRVLRSARCFQSVPECLFVSDYLSRLHVVVSWKQLVQYSIRVLSDIQRYFPQYRRVTKWGETLWIRDAVASKCYYRHKQGRLGSLASFYKPEPHEGILLDGEITEYLKPQFSWWPLWAFPAYSGRGLGRWLNVYFSLLRSGWLPTHVSYSGSAAERLKSCAPPLCIQLLSKTLSGVQLPLNFLCFLWSEVDLMLR